MWSLHTFVISWCIWASEDIRINTLLMILAISPTLLCDSVTQCLLCESFYLLSSSELHLHRPFVISHFSTVSHSMFVQDKTSVKPVWNQCETSVKPVTCTGNGRTCCRPATDVNAHSQTNISVSFWSDSRRLWDHDRWRKNVFIYRKRCNRITN